MVRKLFEVDCVDAKDFFLKNSSYFNADLPDYLSFEPVLADVAAILVEAGLAEDGTTKFIQKGARFDGVNYEIITNKDGRFAWRPFELIHPVIYVALVHLLCSSSHWKEITQRFCYFKSKGCAVRCCSLPVISSDNQSDTAEQVKNWWITLEQQSLRYSLSYSHLLHTDVTDCYGSLYTHSIAWALYGRKTAKRKKHDKSLLGNQIDELIRAGRSGQTNGISQGSVLMDVIAELVLGWVDTKITHALSQGKYKDFQILRYRDDYRIFTNSDVQAEEILKCISDTLRLVGMRLGVSKTVVAANVIEGSIKPDKMAGIHLHDMDVQQAKTLQKQLLRLHAFCRQFPNSGALRRLLSECHSKISEQKEKPENLEVQIAIVTDIGRISPQAFPAIAGILSHLISLADDDEKKKFWEKVRSKMQKVPNNGYLDIWLQRVIKPLDITFQSKEKICQIVEGQVVPLWNNQWLDSQQELVAAVDASKLLIKDPKSMPEVIKPKEIELFTKSARYEGSG